MTYLGLKGALQRAEGPGRRDDGRKAGHGRRVGVEELREKRGRGGVRMVRSVSETPDNSLIRQWRWNKQVIVMDEPQHSVFFPIFQDCLGGGNYK